MAELIEILFGSLVYEPEPLTIDYDTLNNILNNHKIGHTTYQLTRTGVRVFESKENSGIRSCILFINLQPKDRLVTLYDYRVDGNRWRIGKNNIVTTTLEEAKKFILDSPMNRY